MSLELEKIASPTIDENPKPDLKTQEEIIVLENLRNTPRSIRDSMFSSSAIDLTPFTEGVTIENCYIKKIENRCNFPNSTVSVIMDLEIHSTNGYRYLTIENSPIATSSVSTSSLYSPIFTSDGGGQLWYVANDYETTATPITTCYKSFWYPTKRDPKEKLLEIIRSRQSPLIVSNKKPLVATTDIREMRARETLKRVIGEDKFRSFLKTGFISVKSKSGLVYQIFPSSHFTCVYKQGIMIERLCVVLNGGFPPTDSLIMRFLLILNDEQQFRSLANVHRAEVKENKVFKPEHRSLVEIYEELKGKRVA